MKKEYDFSKSERGKFYHKNAKFHLPIYLDEEMESCLHHLQKKTKQKP